MPTTGNRWILSKRPARTPPPATTPPDQHVHPQSGIPRYEVTDSQSTVPASLFTVGNDQLAVPQANFNATATLEESSFNAGAVASDTPSLISRASQPWAYLFKIGEEEDLMRNLGRFLMGRTTFVRSCYKSLVGYPPIPQHVKWAKIWNFPIPPKVKMFAWQVCSNTLPTASNLISRRVDCSQFCSLCSNAVETTSHVLIYCDVAMSCWNNFENIYMENDLDITVWLERNMEKLSTEAFGLLLTACWMIWQERNNRVWNNAHATSPRLLDHAASFLATWRSLQSSTKAPTAVIYPTAWQAPPSGYLKVNVDAANDIVSKVTGVASLIRDNAGSFHATLQLKLNGYHSAKIAEAIAVREALKWLKSRRVDNIQIESDALLVVEGIKTSTGCSSFDLIMSDIRVLAVNFHSLSFVFAKRSANKAAHLLAKDALLIADRKEWCVFPPSFLSDVLSSDLLS
nr:uncharacterized protein LOC109155154 [Ipomoea batatas]